MAAESTEHPQLRVVLPCGLVHLQLARRPGLGAKAEGLSQAGGVQREVLQMFCGLHKRKRWSLAWRAGDRNNTLKQGLIFEAPALQLALAMGGAFHHAISSGILRTSSTLPTLGPKHSGPKLYLALRPKTEGKDPGVFSLDPSWPTAQGVGVIQIQPPVQGVPFWGKNTVVLSGGIMLCIFRDSG